jgi:hypothetical protein
VHYISTGKGLGFQGTQRKAVVVVVACLLTRAIPEPWFGISKQQQAAAAGCAWDESIGSIRETTVQGGGDFF